MNKKKENNNFLIKNYNNEDYNDEIQGKYYNKYIDTSDSNNIQE